MYPDRPGSESKAFMLGCDHHGNGGSLVFGVNTATVSVSVYIAASSSYMLRL